METHKYLWSHLGPPRPLDSTPTPRTRGRFPGDSDFDPGAAEDQVFFRNRDGRYDSNGFFYINVVDNRNFYFAFTDSYCPSVLPKR